MRTGPEFAAALHGQVGTSTRVSATPWESTSSTTRRRFREARCGWRTRLSAIREANRQVRNDLLKSSAVAALIALVLAFIATQSIGRRLARITDFAERVAAGDLSARIEEESSRRNRACRLGAGQDGAQAGGRLPDGGVEPPDAGDAAELHAGSR